MTNGKELTELEAKRNELKVKLLMIGILIILSYILDIYITIRAIIHWFTNDSLTLIGIIKWTFSKYLIPIVYCFIMSIIKEGSYRDECVYYKSLEYRITKMKKELGIKS